MTRSYRTVAFRDELLADGSVRRAYADGRQEWRRRGPGAAVSWRDSSGRTGSDELLGQRILKRRIDPATVLYGRDVGFGRTTWGDGILTLNETSLGGRSAAVLAAVGAAGLLPAVVDPPFELSFAEEEQLRQVQLASSSSSDGGGGSDGGTDWSSSDDSSGDDFG